jgi:hypothetical protein
MSVFTTLHNYSSYMALVDAYIYTYKRREGMKTRSRFRFFL